MTEHLIKVKCRLCETSYAVIERKCPGCSTLNHLFKGEDVVQLSVEVEPEVYRSLQRICGDLSKTLPEVVVLAIEYFITSRTRRKTS